ncbi:Ankyrin repeat family protein [Prunus dulcis]|uniref:Ankyrin repeat family protein n=1 Tax=Prunus dulcis TaxID=3755 RepID=A0A4Y1RW76_PRUDU|nr:Ankyrin repeat family protein [Prunus dulcis]
MALITTGGNPSSSATDDIELLNLNYYQELYRAALKGNWKEAKSFLDRDPDAVKARISNLKMTALHVAACEGHSEFVENIVALMPAAELAQLDDLGYTALHYAAIGGSLRSAKALLAANSNLTQVVDSEGRTPLLLAASLGSESKEVVWYLLLVTTDEKPGQPFTGPRAAYLVNVLIASGLHVLPVEVDYRPPRSVRAHVVGHESVQDQLRMPTQNKGQASARFRQLQDAKLRHHCAVELVQQICKQISKKNVSERSDYLLKLEILNTATVNGTTEILRILLNFFPDLIWVRFSNNRFLVLTYAIEHRHENLFRMVCDKTARNKLMAFAVLEPRETILHLAAKLPPLSQLSSISGAALQMQRELQWFKVVENLVHPYYKEYPNTNLETARELFTKEHKQLAESGEKWLKDTSNSCMLVATLVATVVFAAAFTAPGGNNDDGDPNFLDKKTIMFMVFAVSDAISLFASLTSLLMFLSILTARYAEEDFLDHYQRS